MIKYLYVSLIIFLFKPLTFANEWELVGFKGTTIDCLAINPVDKNIIYAGIKDTGIYESTDAGINWNLVYNFQNSVYCLAIDRMNVQNVYAGYNDGILISTSEGSHFKQIIIEKNIKVNTIILDETQTKAIILGTAKGIYKSFDGGKSFLSAGLNNFSITCLTINNSGSKAVLYAGTSTAGVYKSANYGVSWSPVNTGLENTQIYSIICDMKKPSVLLLGTLEESIYRSENNGENWIKIDLNNKVNQGYSFAQAIDNTTNNSVIFITSFSGNVYKTFDYGISVSKVSESLNKIYGTCLGVTNIIPSTLYLGTTAGLYKYIE